MSDTEELIAEAKNYGGDNGTARWPSLITDLGEALSTARADIAKESQRWDDAMDHIATLQADLAARHVDGAGLIAAERRRHISEEGYDAEHDRGHAPELIGAAREYAALARFEVWNPELPHPELIAPQIEWPWHRDYFKPTGDPVRDLTKAGSLIAAAIDSLRTTPTEGATT